MKTTLMTSDRIAWHNKGFNDGRYHEDVKKPPEDQNARAAYLRGHRIGKRERLRALADGDERGPS